MYLLLLLAQTPLPSNWETWGLTGFLLFVILGLSSAVVWLVKWKRDSEKDRDENFVPKDVYNSLLLQVAEFEKRCRECTHANGEVLRKIHELIGEISASETITAQALSAIRQTIESALMRGGN